MLKWISILFENFFRVDTFFFVKYLLKFNTKLYWWNIQQLASFNTISLYSDLLVQQHFGLVDHFYCPCLPQQRWWQHFLAFEMIHSFTYLSTFANIYEKRETIFTLLWTWKHLFLLLFSKCFHCNGMQCLQI